MNRTHLLVVLLPFALLSTSIPLRARADTSHGGGYVGVVGGANFPTGSRASTTPTVGVTAGTTLSAPIGIGAYLTYFGQTSSGNLLGLPSGSSTTNYVLAGELNIYMQGLHIGADIGAGVTSWSGSVSTITASSSNTYLIYGPEAGFDIFLLSPISIGADVHALFNNQSSDSTNIQAVATVKLWL